MFIAAGSSRKSDLAWLLLPALTALLLAGLRWKAYGVVHVDFGQEMVAPWLIAQGKHLYTDIAYFKGPFSPHFNALLLTLFGVSLRTIFVANILIATGVAYEILALARRACGLPLGSVLACAFLLVFGFSVDTDYNNFNFISPFVHELTHGTAFSLLTLLALERWRRTGHARESVLAGIAYGFAWLTRIEISFALTAACAVWIWSGFRTGTPLRNIARGMLQSLGAAAAVILVAIILLHQTMPWTSAVASAFATVHALLFSSVRVSPFFLNLGGWNHPFAALAFQVATLFIAFLWLLFFYAAADFWGKNERLMGSLFAALGLFTVIFLSGRILPLLHGTFLTLTTLGITAIACRGVHKRGCEASDQERIAAVLGIFALAMLGKIALLPSIRFYGFVHAMPAYLLLVAALLTALPTWVCRRIGHKGAHVFLVLMVIALTFEIGSKARIDQVLANRKTIPIGSGADEFFVADHPNMRNYVAFLKEAPSLIPAGSTLSVLPEGVMLNYLLRLPLGTSVLNMMRTEYYIFGRERIEGELFSRRPDFIVLTHKDTSVFGLPLYGKMPEYGADVMAWLKREYEQIALYGKQPLAHPTSEGVALWRRKDL